MPGCAAEHLARGFCRKHYARWRAHGDPLYVSHGAGLRLIDAALASWDRSACWSDWPHGHQHGYPTVGGRNRKVAHVVLERTVGPRPFPAAMALHSCDEPACWNPAHLRWGSHQQNMADMVERDRRKGVRSFAGQASPMAKLSDAQVFEIRRRYRPGRNQWTGRGNGAELAREFGVSPDTIRKVARGQNRGGS